MEALLSINIIFASKIWKGFVFLESEIWKEWQFTLVLSLEGRVFLWGVEFQERKVTWAYESKANMCPWVMLNMPP